MARKLAVIYGALATLALLGELFRWDIVYWRLWDTPTHRVIGIEFAGGIIGTIYIIYTLVRELRR